MTRARTSISSLVITGFVALAFSIAPVGLDDDFTPETKTAFAKGKGSGSSSGRGGSNRGGGNRGGSSSSSSSGQDLVHGSSNSQNKGANAESAQDNHGSLASALGNLNAAHASPTALEHASDNSIVGLLAAYAEAVEGGLTEEEQQQELGAISNKSYEDPELGDVVDTEVVTEVNSLLGVPSE
jgi:hypothetical protein